MSYSFFTLAFLLSQPSMIGYITQSETVKIIKQEHLRIEDIRNQYESQILTIEGVVYVSNGICSNGNPCLKIGTSLPTSYVRAELPDGLFAIQVQLDYVGRIRP